jgi:hypothetical protein
MQLFCAAKARTAKEGIFIQLWDFILETENLTYFTRIQILEYHTLEVERDVLYIFSMFLIVAELLPRLIVHYVYLVISLGEILTLHFFIIKLVGSHLSKTD